MTNKKQTNRQSTKQSMKRINEKVVVKGIYKYPSGTYVVRPIVNGKQMRVSFSSFKAAKAFYKSINS